MNKNIFNLLLSIVKSGTGHDKKSVILIPQMREKNLVSKKVRKIGTILEEMRPYFSGIGCKVPGASYDNEKNAVIARIPPGRETKQSAVSKTKARLPRPFRIRNDNKFVIPIRSTLNALRYFTFTKSVAIITLLCFIYTSVLSQALYGMVDKVQQAKKAKAALEEFIIPFSVGRITDSTYFGSNKVVINIQDLHCHSEVQRNISKILGILDQRYGISKVYIEGGIGPVDTSWVKLIDEDIREKVIHNLLDKGRLTGAEYYSIMQERNNLLYGIENEAEYKENIVRLGKILLKREKIVKLTPHIKDKLETLKNKYYTRKNKKIEKLIRGKKERKLDSAKYIKKLVKEGRKAGLYVSKYKNIQDFLKLLDLQHKFNYKKINKELRDFIAGLKDRIPFSVYRKLLEKTNNLKNLDEMYVYLIKIAKEYKINIANEFRELHKFFRYVEINEAINSVGLIREENELIRDLHERLSKSGAEKEVTFICDFYNYLESYLNNKINAEDYEYFKNNLDEFKLYWSKYITTVASDSGLGENRDASRRDASLFSPNQPSADDTGLVVALEPYYDLFDQFYNVNVERNKYFVQNIFKETKDVPTPQIRLIPDVDHYKESIKTLEKAKDIVVVITGGFHTYGFSELLKDRKLTNIVITPNATSDDKNAEKIYNSLAIECAEIFSVAANQEKRNANLMSTPGVDKKLSVKNSVIAIPQMREKQSAVSTEKTGLPRPLGINNESKIPIPPASQFAPDLRIFTAFYEFDFGKPIEIGLVRSAVRSILRIAVLGDNMKPGEVAGSVRKLFDARGISQILELKALPSNKYGLVLNTGDGKQKTFIYQVTDEDVIQIDEKDSDAPPVLMLPSTEGRIRQHRIFRKMEEGSLLYNTAAVAIAPLIERREINNIYRLHDLSMKAATAIMRGEYQKQYEKAKREFLEKHDLGEENYEENYNLLEAGFEGVMAFMDKRAPLLGITLANIIAHARYNYRAIREGKPLLMTPSRRRGISKSERRILDATGEEVLDSNLGPIFERSKKNNRVKYKDIYSALVDIHGVMTGAAIPNKEEIKARLREALNEYGLPFEEVQNDSNRKQRHMAKFRDNEFFDPVEILAIYLLITVRGDGNVDNTGLQELYFIIEYCKNAGVVLTEKDIERFDAVIRRLDAKIRDSYLYANRHYLINELRRRIGELASKGKDAKPSPKLQKPEQLSLWDEDDSETKTVRRTKGRFKKWSGDIGKISGSALILFALQNALPFLSSLAAGAVTQAVQAGFGLGSLLAIFSYITSNSGIVLYVILAVVWVTYQALTPGPVKGSRGPNIGSLKRWKPILDVAESLAAENRYHDSITQIQLVLKGSTGYGEGYRSLGERSASAKVHQEVERVERLLRELQVKYLMNIVDEEINRQIHDPDEKLDDSGIIQRFIDEGERLGFSDEQILFLRAYHHFLFSKITVTLDRIANYMSEYGGSRRTRDEAYDTYKQMHSMLGLNFVLSVDDEEAVRSREKAMFDEMTDEFLEELCSIADSYDAFKTEIVVTTGADFITIERFLSNRGLSKKKFEKIKTDQKKGKLVSEQLIVDGYSVYRAKRGTYLDEKVYRSYIDRIRAAISVQLSNPTVNTVDVDGNPFYRIKVNGNQRLYLKFDHTTRRAYVLAFANAGDIKAKESGKGSLSARFKVYLSNYAVIDDKDMAPFTVETRKGLAGISKMALQHIVGAATELRDMAETFVGRILADSALEGKETGLTEDRDITKAKDGIQFGNLNLSQEDIERLKSLGITRIEVQPYSVSAIKSDTGIGVSDRQLIDNEQGGKTLLILVASDADIDACKIHELMEFMALNVEGSVWWNVFNKYLKARGLNRDQLGENAFEHWHECLKDIWKDYTDFRRFVEYDRFNINETVIQQQIQLLESMVDPIAKEVFDSLMGILPATNLTLEIVKREILRYQESAPGLVVLGEDADKVIQELNIVKDDIESTLAGETDGNVFRRYLDLMNFEADVNLPPRLADSLLYILYQLNRKPNGYQSKGDKLLLYVESVQVGAFDMDINEQDQAEERLDKLPVKVILQRLVQAIDISMVGLNANLRDLIAERPQDEESKMKLLGKKKALLALREGFSKVANEEGIPYIDVTGGHGALMKLNKKTQAVLARIHKNGSNKKLRDIAMLTHIRDEIDYALDYYETQKTMSAQAKVSQTAPAATTRADDDKQELTSELAQKILRDLDSPDSSVAGRAVKLAERYVKRLNGIKGILLDIGGVLLEQDMEALEVSFNKIFDELNLGQHTSKSKLKDLNREMKKSKEYKELYKIIRAGQQSYDAIVELFNNEYLSKHNIPSVTTAQYAKLFRAPFVVARNISGNPQILETLKSRYKVKILSDQHAPGTGWSESQDVDDALNRDFPNQFPDGDHIRSHRIGFSKHSQEAFVEGARQMGLNPEEIAFFDDVDEFNQRARDLGMIASTVETSEETGLARNFLFNELLTGEWRAQVAEKISARGFAGIARAAVTEVVRVVAGSALKTADAITETVDAILTDNIEELKVQGKYKTFASEEISPEGINVVRGFQPRFLQGGPERALLQGNLEGFVSKGINQIEVRKYNVKSIQSDSGIGVSSHHIEDGKLIINVAGGINGEVTPDKINERIIHELIEFMALNVEGSVYHEALNKYLKRIGKTRGQLGKEAFEYWHKCIMDIKNNSEYYKDLEGFERLKATAAQQAAFLETIINPIAKALAETINTITGVSVTTQAVQEAISKYLNTSLVSESMPTPDAGLGAGEDLLHKRLSKGVSDKITRIVGREFPGALQVRALDQLNRYFSWGVATDHPLPSTYPMREYYGLEKPKPTQGAIITQERIDSSYKNNDRPGVDGLKSWIRDNLSPTGVVFPVNDRRVLDGIADIVERVKTQFELSDDDILEYSEDELHMSVMSYGHYLQRGDGTAADDGWKIPDHKMPIVAEVLSEYPPQTVHFRGVNILPNGMIALCCHIENEEVLASMRKRLMDRLEKGSAPSTFHITVARILRAPTNEQNDYANNQAFLRELSKINLGNAEYFQARTHNGQRIPLAGVPDGEIVGEPYGPVATTKAMMDTADKILEDSPLNIVGKQSIHKMLRHEAIKEIIIVLFRGGPIPVSVLVRVIHDIYALNIDEKLRLSDYFEFRKLPKLVNKGGFLHRGRIFQRIWETAAMQSAIDKDNTALEVVEEYVKDREFDYDTLRRIFIMLTDKKLQNTEKRWVAARILILCKLPEEGVDFERLFAGDRRMMKNILNAIGLSTAVTVVGSDHILEICAKTIEDPGAGFAKVPTTPVIHEIFIPGAPNMSPEKLIDVLDILYSNRKPTVAQLEAVVQRLHTFNIKESTIDVKRLYLGKTVPFHLRGRRRVTRSTIVSMAWKKAGLASILDENHGPIRKIGELIAGRRLGNSYLRQLFMMLTDRFPGREETRSTGALILSICELPEEGVNFDELFNRDIEMRDRILDAIVPSTQSTLLTREQIQRKCNQHLRVEYSNIIRKFGRAPPTRPPTPDAGLGAGEVQKGERPLGPNQGVFRLIRDPDYVFPFTVGLLVGAVTWLSVIKLIGLGFTLAATLAATAFGMWLAYKVVQLIKKQRAEKYDSELHERIHKRLHDDLLSSQQIRLDTIGNYFGISSMEVRRIIGDLNKKLKERYVIRGNEVSDKYFNEEFIPDQRNLSTEMMRVRAVLSVRLPAIDSLLDETELTLDGAKSGLEDLNALIREEHGIDTVAYYIDEKDNQIKWNMVVVNEHSVEMKNLQNLQDRLLRLLGTFKHAFDGPSNTDRWEMVGEKAKDLDRLIRIKILNSGYRIKPFYSLLDIEDSKIGIRKLLSDFTDVNFYSRERERNKIAEVLVKRVELLTDVINLLIKDKYYYVEKRVVKQQGQVDSLVEVLAVDEIVKRIKQRGAMKDLGPRKATDEDFKIDLSNRHAEFVALARESWPVIFDHEAPKSIVVFVDELPVAAYHFRSEELKVPIIVINSSKSYEVREEGRFHESREAYWMDRGYKQHEAHIAASAEQALKFMSFDEDGRIIGTTKFHEQQLLEMSEDRITEIINEDESTRSKFHHKVLERMKNDGILSQDDIDKVLAYETVLRIRAMFILAMKTRMSSPSVGSDIGDFIRSAGKKIERRKENLTGKERYLPPLTHEKILLSYLRGLRLIPDASLPDDISALEEAEYGAARRRAAIKVRRILEELTIIQGVTLGYEDYVESIEQLRSKLIEIFRIIYTFDDSSAMVEKLGNIWSAFSVHRNKLEELLSDEDEPGIEDFANALKPSRKKLADLLEDLAVAIEKTEQASASGSKTVDVLNPVSATLASGALNFRWIKEFLGIESDLVLWIIIGSIALVFTVAMITIIFVIMKWRARPKNTRVAALTMHEEDEIERNIIAMGKCINKFHGLREDAKKAQFPEGQRFLTLTSAIPTISDKTETLRIMGVSFVLSDNFPEGAPYSIIQSKILLLSALEDVEKNKYDDAQRKFREIIEKLENVRKILRIILDNKKVYIIKKMHPTRQEMTEHVDFKRYEDEKRQSGRKFKVQKHPGKDPIVVYIDDLRLQIERALGETSRVHYIHIPDGSVEVAINFKQEVSAVLRFPLNGPPTAKIVYVKEYIVDDENVPAIKTIEDVPFTPNKFRYPFREIAIADEIDKFLGIKTTGKIIGYLRSFGTDGFAPARRFCTEINKWVERVNNVMDETSGDIAAHTSLLTPTLRAITHHAEDYDKQLQNNTDMHDIQMKARKIADWARAASECGGEKDRINVYLGYINRSIAEIKTISEDIYTEGRAGRLFWASMAEKRRLKAERQAEEAEKKGKIRGAFYEIGGPLGVLLGRKLLKWLYGRLKLVYPRLRGSLIRTIAPGLEGKNFFTTNNDLSSVVSLAKTGVNVFSVVSEQELKAMEKGLEKYNSDQVDEKEKVKINRKFNLETNIFAEGGTVSARGIEIKTWGRSLYIIGYDQGSSNTTALSVMKDISGSRAIRGQMGMPVNECSVDMVEVSGRIDARFEETYVSSPEFRRTVLTYSRSTEKISESATEIVDMFNTGDWVVDLNSMDNLLRRKAITGYMQGEPLVSATISDIHKLLHEGEIESYGDIDTFMLSSELSQPDQDTLNSVIDKLHSDKYGKRIGSDHLVKEKSQINEAKKNILARVKAGIDAVRIDLSRYDGDINEIADDIIRIRKDIISLNSDATIGLVLPKNKNFTEGNIAKGVMDGIKVVVYITLRDLIEDPDVLKKIPKGCWLEIVDKVDGKICTLPESAKEDLSSKMAMIIRSQAGIIGIRSWLLEEMKKRYESKKRKGSFSEFLTRIIRRRLRKLEKDPEYMAQKGLEDGVADYTDEVIASSITPAKESAILESLIAYRKNGLTRERCEELMSGINEGYKKVEDDKVYIEYAANYLTGLLQMRLAIRSIGSQRPYINERHVRMLGRGLIEGKILLGETGTADIKAAAMVAKLQRLQVEDVSEELKALLRLEAEVKKRISSEGASLGMVKGEVKLLVNRLDYIIRNGRPQDMQQAIAAQLRILEAYADKDVKNLIDKFEADFLDALPATAQAISTAG